MDPDVMSMAGSEFSDAQEVPTPLDEQLEPPDRSRQQAAMCSVLCRKEVIEFTSRYEKRLGVGDHIKAVPKVGYAHHGVYVGAGRVVHFCSDTGTKAGVMAVRETCLHGFVGGCKVEIEVVRYPAGDCFDGQHSARVARQHLGRKGFSLLGSNCEHFASMCKDGRGVSRQVEVLEKAGKSTLAASAGAVGGGYAAASIGSSTAPAVAGSTYLGGVAQGLLSHTTLGGILTSSGVAPATVLIPASPIIVATGLLFGAVIGAAATLTLPKPPPHPPTVTITTTFSPLHRGSPVYGPYPLPPKSPLLPHILTLIAELFTTRITAEATVFYYTRAGVYTRVTDDTSLEEGHNVVSVVVLLSGEDREL